MELTPDPIRNINLGLWASQTLGAAVERELFTIIFKNSHTIEGIAQKANINTRPCEMLLNACTALNLLRKENNQYFLNELSEKFLVKGKPTYYGDMAILFSGRGCAKWATLTQAIMNNSPTERKLSEKLTGPKHAEMFTKAMHNNAVKPAMELSNRIDFSRYQNLLDLGAGAATYPVILTKKYPNLKATAFETPSVAQQTRKFIGDNPNIIVKEGNFHEDTFPEGHDILLFAQIFHSYSPEENKQLLKKAYKVLPENGLLIINDFLLTDDKTEPLFATLFAVNMLIQSKGGNAYSGKEIKSWLEDIDFKNIKQFHLAGPTSTITAEK